VTLLVALELISKKLDIDPSLMVYYKCKINEKPKRENHYERSETRLG
jgi:hypothetical protein